MGFVERYVRALDASDLQNDAQHGQVDALLAAAFAAAGRYGDLGPLLHRVKYADDPMRNPGNLAQLLRLWTAEVTKRGRTRKWVPENTAWDAQAARKLYQTVAELSLAYWIDGTCKSCGGTSKVGENVCPECRGSGNATVVHTGGFVRERVKDMVSELHGIAAAHAARAKAKLNSRVTESSSEK